MRIRSGNLLAVATVCIALGCAILTHGREPKPKEGRIDKLNTKIIRVRDRYYDLRASGLPSYSRRYQRALSRLIGLIVQALNLDPTGGWEEELAELVHFRITDRACQEGDE